MQASPSSRSECSRGNTALSAAPCVGTTQDRDGNCHPNLLASQPPAPQCCPLPDTGVLSTGFPPATPGKTANTGKKKEKKSNAPKKTPSNFSTQHVKPPWKANQENLCLYIMLKPALNHHPSCQACGSGDRGCPSSGMRQVKVYRERGDPGEADEEGWRWGRQILFVLSS